MPCQPLILIPKHATINIIKTIRSKDFSRGAFMKNSVLLVLITNLAMKYISTFLLALIITAAVFEQASARVADMKPVNDFVKFMKLCKNSPPETRYVLWHKYCAARDFKKYFPNADFEEFSFYVVVGNQSFNARALPFISHKNVSKRRN